MKADPDIAPGLLPIRPIPNLFPGRNDKDIPRHYRNTFFMNTESPKTGNHIVQQPVIPHTGTVVLIRPAIFVTKNTRRKGRQTFLQYNLPMGHNHSSFQRFAILFQYTIMRSHCNRISQKSNFSTIASMFRGSPLSNIFELLATKPYVWTHEHPLHSFVFLRRGCLLSVFSGSVQRVRQQFYFSVLPGRSTALRILPTEM